MKMIKKIMLTFFFVTLTAQAMHRTAIAHENDYSTSAEQHEYILSAYHRDPDKVSRAHMLKQDLAVSAGIVGSGVIAAILGATYYGYNNCNNSAAVSLNQARQSLLNQISLLGTALLVCGSTLFVYSRTLSKQSADVNEITESYDC